MTEPAWLIEARKYIGLKEIPGSAENGTIVQFWKTIRRGGIKSESVPWCAAFVGAMLETVGVISTRFESAKSYEKWGVKLDAPAVGCVVVFTRDGGGHVGFVVGQDKAGNLLVLGGNQGDAVNIKTFPRSRVTSYRWPAGITRPVTNLPLLASAEVSKNEA